MVKNRYLWEHIHEIASDANFYENKYPSSQLQAFASHHVKQYLDSNKSLNDIAWLEYGCGSGQGVKYIANRFNQITHYNLLDVSNCALDKAQIAVNESNINNSLSINSYKLCSPILPLPYPAKSIDIVNAESSLYYNSFNDLSIAIDHIYSSLKSNAIGRFTLKADDDRYAKERFKISEYTYKLNLPAHWEDQMTISCLSYKSIKRLFQKFQKVSIGKEKYSYTSTEEYKSFWIITTIK